MKKLIMTTALAGLVLAGIGFAYANDAPVQPGVDSTAGGGAPAGDVSKVVCNILLGLKVTKAGTADLKAVTFQIPANLAGAYDIYYPVFDGYEDVLRIGGDIAKVQVCETPVGRMIDIVTAFNDQGTARALLPVNAGDGFQVLMVDGNKAFHTAIYTGAEDTLDFSK